MPLCLNPASKSLGIAIAVLLYGLAVQLEGSRLVGAALHDSGVELFEDLGLAFHSKLQRPLPAGVVDQPEPVALSMQLLPSQ